MAKTKEQKKEIIENIKQHLKKQVVMFFIDFQKLKAEDIFTLRNKLKQADSLLYIAKKNLVKIVFKNEKIPVEIDQLQGQLGLVFGFQNEILPAKTIYNTWQKHQGPQILGGFYQGEFINAKQAIELAKLPSKQELLARLAGSLSSPISGLVSALGGNIKGLMFILNQQSKTQ